MYKCLEKAAKGMKKNDRVKLLDRCAVTPPSPKKACEVRDMAKPYPKLPPRKLPNEGGPWTGEGWREAAAAGAQMRGAMFPEKLPLVGGLGLSMAADCRDAGATAHAWFGMGGDGDGTPANALQHCVFACCIAFDAGEKVALRILDTHENNRWRKPKGATDPQPPSKEQMAGSAIDDKNNRVGVAIGMAMRRDTKRNPATNKCKMMMGWRVDYRDCCKWACLCALNDQELF